LAPVVRLNAVEVLAAASGGVVLGGWLKRRIPVLDRLSIPAPVAGGLALALAFLALRDRVVNIEPDLVLREVAMVAFFTTIGMGATWRRVREGGPAVLVLLALATAGAVLQNALGAGAAWLLGIPPLIGVVSGSVALAGGPATALAFGRTFDSLGVRGAGEIGLASATAGILAAGVFAGFAGSWFARRLRTSGTYAGPSASAAAPAVSAPALISHVAAIGIAMGIGSLLSAGIGRAGVVLPSYVGAMIAAAVIRHAAGGRGWMAFSDPLLGALGETSLSLFIVMALIGLRLWELVHLAAPVALILLLQLALMAILCLACFRIMGRDYEAAVMTAGYCGFMLGTTANALASMDEVTREFGPAPRAFLVVPVVGAFLIDFTNALVITISANLLK
jgi:glutamate:Na+ symporter, ESS family